MKEAPPGKERQEEWNNEGDIRPSRTGPCVHEFVRSSAVSFVCIYSDASPIILTREREVARPFCKTRPKIHLPVKSSKDVLPGLLPHSLGTETARLPRLCSGTHPGQAYFIITAGQEVAPELQRAIQRLHLGWKHYSWTLEVQPSCQWTNTGDGGCSSILAVGSITK
jgi:hypothetical protein